ncbi:uncharacterized protein LOC134447264 [Engraulis encrasicolus]|uniref:uncharacterized protein LOC134447264 n=1 Tax=Engraulis encrasicolus TaxID=184585 RepID=UPI002FD3FEDC
MRQVHQVATDHGSSCASEPNVTVEAAEERLAEDELSLSQTTASSSSPPPKRGVTLPVKKALQKRLQKSEVQRAEWIESVKKNGNKGKVIQESHIMVARLRALGFRPLLLIGHYDHKKQVWHTDPVVPGVLEEPQANILKQITLLYQDILGAVRASEKHDTCVSGILEPQSTQNESDSHGDSNDEDWSEDVDEGDSQSDSDEGQSDTSQHDQQSDSDQRGQTPFSEREVNGTNGLNDCRNAVERTDNNNKDPPSTGEEDGLSTTAQGSLHKMAVNPGKTVYGMPKLKCNECGKIFYFARNLEKHEKTHTKGVSPAKMDKHDKCSSAIHEGDPQRDSDEGQHDTSQHDQQSDSEQSSQTPISEKEVNGTNGLNDCRNAVERTDNSNSNKDPPSTGEEDGLSTTAQDLTSLRMWVPPLRLLSASIWQVVQQRQVQSYNRVEEFVSVVLELVPDLLSSEEKIELLLGLRAKLVLELCHDQPLSMTDQMMQPHLEKVTRVAENTFSDGEMGQTVDAAVRNFVDLIQALVKSPEYRRHYFQDTYPLHYGQRFDTALQSLVEEFLSRLELLLPVPSFHQVAAWFDEEPLILEDFLQLVHDPKPIQGLLDHYKDLTRLKSDSSSPIMTNTILSTLTDSPKVQEFLAACVQKEECLRLLREQSSQNKSETRGGSNDEDWSGDVDEGNPQRDSNGGQNDTSQHDQQRDSEQSSQTCNGLSSSYIVVDWRGDEDDDGDDDDDDDGDDDPNDVDWSEDVEGGDSQRDSDDDQSDTSQHDQQSDSEQSSQTPLSEKEVNGTNGLNGCKRDVETIVNIKIVEKGLPSTGEENGASPTVQGSLTNCPAAVVDNGVFRCIECGRVYAYVGSLTKHMKTHNKILSPAVQSSLRKVAVIPRTTNGRKFRCTECGKAFVYATCLNNHKKIHTDFNPGLRMRTGETSVNNKNEETDLASSDEGKGLSFTVQDSSQLGKLSANERTVNIDNEQEDLPSTGDENGSSPAVQSSLHKVTDEPRTTHGRKFRCTECGKAYVYASCLNNHKKTHTDFNPGLKRCTGVTGEHNKNEETDLDFNPEIKRHKNTHGEILTGEEKHLCPYCGRAFRRIAYLREHIKTHTGHRPYVCPVCDKGFKQHSTLVSHKRLHTGEKPYLCSFCGKAFVTSGACLHHTRIHTGERPYKCEICEKTFTMSCHLTIHRRRHTDEKPFLCTVCPKRFKSPSVLKHHMRIHTGEKPYECLICGMKFADSTRRNAHQRCHRK